MAYNGSIPNASDFISASQQQIKDNFTAIDSASFGFAVDHVTLTDVTNGGKHKKSTYVQQGSDQATGVDEMSVYAKDNSGASDLYVRRESNGTVLQLTGNATLSGSEYTVVTPWGLTFKYGLGTASPAGSANSFATNFPTAAQGIVITVRNAGQQGSAAVISGANSFTAYCESGTQTIYYSAWGT